MSRYDHKIETSLEGIENLSKEKKEKERRKRKFPRFSQGYAYIIEVLVFWRYNPIS